MRNYCVPPTSNWISRSRRVEEGRNVPPTPGRHKTLLNGRRPFVVVATRGQRTAISVHPVGHVRLWMPDISLTHTRVRKATSPLRVSAAPRCQSPRVHTTRLGIIPRAPFNAPRVATLSATIIPRHDNRSSPFYRGSNLRRSGMIRAGSAIVFNDHDGGALTALENGIIEIQQCGERLRFSSSYSAM